MKRRWTLRAKIGAAAGLPICALALLLVLYVPSSVRREGLAALEGEAEGMGQTAAHSLRAALTFFDPEAAQDVLASTSQNPLLSSAAVLDAEGELFVSYGSVQALLEPSSHEVGILTRRTEILAAERHVGTLILGLSTERLEATVANSRNRVLILSALVLLVGNLLSFLTSGMITRPLSALTKAANRIAEGNFEQHVHIRTADEIGQLGAAFNQMAQGLVSRTEALRKEAIEREAAEAASEAKSHFISVMSHEIRTPMNGVLGMLEVLRRSGLEPKHRDYAEKATRSARSLLDLLNGILDFSKIEAGKATLQSEPFELEDLVADVAELMAPQAAEKGVEVILDIDPATPGRVLGDPGRIRQTLINLVGNAVKFTEEGHVVIELSAVSGPTGATLYRFAVTDTGIGIASDQMDRIFGFFVQVDSTDTRKFGGTGLGLAITSRIVSLLGGQLGVDSQPGQGSTFWMEIPLDLDEPGTDLPRTASGVEPGRVLIVEGLEPARRALEHLTQDLEMKTRSVGSLQEAIDLLRRADSERDAFDYVLLSPLPGEEGTQSLSDLELAHPPRLVLVHLPTERGQIADAHGTAAYLAKPVRRTALQQVLGENPYQCPHAEYSESDRAPEALGGPDDLNKRILVVEDNPINREVASAILRLLGYQVDLAKHGREALEQLDPDRHCLVLMDVQMPEMDGYAATSAIRAMDGPASSIPIVALTAQASHADQARCLDVGMDAFLSKPFTPDELAEVLNDLGLLTAGAVPEPTSLPV